jgi:hypothetical protein
MKLRIIFSQPRASNVLVELSDACSGKYNTKACPNDGRSTRSLSLSTFPSLDSF